METKLNKETPSLMMIIWMLMQKHLIKIYTEEKVLRGNTINLINNFSNINITIDITLQV